MVMLVLLVLGRRVLVGVETSRYSTPEDGNFFCLFSQVEKLLKLSEMLLNS